VIKNIPLYSEMHRFIPAMASIAGTRIAEVKVRHHARRFGASKYGLSRIYKVLLDLMVIKTLASFAARPLLWFGFLALPLLIVGVSVLGYALTAALLHNSATSLPDCRLRRDFPHVCIHSAVQWRARRARLQFERHARAQFARLTQRIGKPAWPSRFKRNDRARSKHRAVGHHSRRQALRERARTLRRISGWDWSRRA
jgi:hypothetical protein